MKNIKLLFVSIFALGAISACQDSQIEGSNDISHKTLASEVALPPGVTLVEEVKSDGSGYNIPFSKYVFDNGLTVILNEDKSDPLVHVNVTYHVGSAREEVGRSGFAHFFEHMMFEGSENVKAGEQHKFVSSVGGTMNGSTSPDKTNYFQTVPSNHLEKILWMEADRMGFLLPAVTQEKFEIQRATVKNERGQRVDNAPYGRVAERVSEVLYPEGHPYSWSTIGYIEDLNRADLSDLKDFFLRWYGPNNGYITISGDFDKQQTLKWIHKYFGSIPPGPGVKKVEPMPVSLSQTKYISLEDNVPQKMLLMTYPTVYVYHADEPALSVLNTIIGRGPTSLLYKKFIENGSATTATSSHTCGELSCSYGVRIMPKIDGNLTLETAEEQVRETFKEFEKRGVTDDDLKRAREAVKSRVLFINGDTQIKASALVSYEMHKGTPNGIEEYLQSYLGVTAEDVMRVYRRYVKDSHSVIMRVVPDGQLGSLKKADTIERPIRNLSNKIDNKELQFRSVLDNFDRAVPPEPAGETPPPRVPVVWEDSFANGISVIGTVHDETPFTEITIKIPAGQNYESLGTLGLASMTSLLLNESTTEHTTEELAEKLGLLASSVSIQSDDRSAIIRVRSLSENIDETLQILREKLFKPAFTDEDIQHVKTLMLQSLEQNKKRSGSLARNTTQRLLFGHENSFVHDNLGTAETLNNLTKQDIEKFYKEHYVAKGTNIIVVSDLNHNDIMEKMSFFSELTNNKNTKTSSIKKFPELNADVIYLIDKPNAAQSEINIARRTFPYVKDGKFDTASFINTPLGGTFSSRINQNLRQDKGYTYGARSLFRSEKTHGYFVASAAVRTDATKDSISEFFKEMKMYAADGPTPSEIDATKTAFVQKEALQYESAVKKSLFLQNILEYDLEHDYVSKRNQQLRSLDVTKAKGLAAELFNPDDMIIVVVGDKQKIASDLEGLFGRSVIELDDNW